jgi:K+ transporter
MKEVPKFVVDICLMLTGPLLFAGMVADWHYPALAAWFDGFNHISSALISFTIAAAVIFLIEMFLNTRMALYRFRFVFACGGALLYQVISESGVFAIMGDPDILDAAYGAVAMIPGAVAGHVYAKYGKKIFPGTL